MPAIKQAEFADQNKTQNELMEEMKDYLTYKDFADQCGFSLGTIRQYAHHGQIPVKYFNGVPMIPQDFILNRKRTGPKSIETNEEFSSHLEKGFIPIKRFSLMHGKSDMQTRIHLKNGRIKNFITVKNKILIHNSEKWPENLREVNSRWKVMKNKKTLSLEEMEETKETIKEEEIKRDPIVPSKPPNLTIKPRQPFKITIRKNS